MCAKLVTDCKIHICDVVGHEVSSCGRLARRKTGRLPVCRIAVMGLGGISPPTLFQCAVMSLEGYPVCVAIYSAALTGSRVLILADVWSGMIAWR